MVSVFLTVGFSVRYNPQNNTNGYYHEMARRPTVTKGRDRGYP